MEWQRIYDLHTFCTNCTEFLTNFAENVHEVFQLVKDSFHSNMNEIFLRNKAYIEPSKYLCQSSNNICLTYGSLNKILLSLRGTTKHTDTHKHTNTRTLQFMAPSCMLVLLRACSSCHAERFSFHIFHILHLHIFTKVV